MLPVDQETRVHAVRVSLPKGNAREMNHFSGGSASTAVNFVSGLSSPGSLEGRAGGDPQERLSAVIDTKFVFHSSLS